MKSDFMQAISILFILWALTRKALLLVDSEQFPGNQKSLIRGRENLRDSEPLNPTKNFPEERETTSPYRDTYWWQRFGWAVAGYCRIFSRFIRRSK